MNLNWIYLPVSRVAYIKIVLIFFFVIFQKANAQSVVINEVSQGPAGSQEYVEFLVTGPNLVNCSDTPPCLDLRGYIFDDNNGFLNGVPTGGVGIASGACRFANDPFWACIPAGTVIVIYNNADPNPSLLPQDISMMDGNCMINVPISSTLFERHNTLPSSSDAAYSAAGWISGGSWTPISMANAADGFQIYAPTNTTTPVFSLGWGPTNSLGDIYMGSGSAAGNVFYADDCDYFNQTSWIDGSAAADQTAGNLNTGQASCVGLMNSNCDPITIVITPTDEICSGACDGSASATVAGGLAPYDFFWSPAPGAGQGTANISGLCDDTYTLTLTNDNGNGCILTETVTINPGPVCCAMTNTESFTNVTCQGSNDGTITLTQSGGLAPVIFSIDGGTTNQASGNFTNLADGIYDILIEDGSGCQYISSITISDGPIQTTPNFNAVSPICLGDPLAALPNNSINSINGTWSPALDNTTTTLYTFTPTIGECATTTNLTITVNPIGNPSFAAVAPICSGDPLAAMPTTSINSINGSWSPALNNAATTLYTFTPTAGQCATTSDLTIQVNPTFSSTTNINICEGSDFTFADGVTHFSILINETYIATLTSIHGCDSILTTNLNVVTDFSSSEFISLCTGEDYTFPDGTVHTNITADETYLSILTSISGCDSIITSIITVNPTSNVTQNIIVCENTNYIFPDGTSQIITTNTSQISNLITTVGCDSIVTTNITMNATFSTAETIIVCENENYFFPDGSSQVITASLTHISSLNSSAGCDSIITTNILMNPTFSIIENITICEGTDYTFPDGITHFGISANEIYTSTFSTTTGCDSIINTILTAQPLPGVSAGGDQLICDGTSVTLSATGASSYAWSGGVVNNIPFTPNQQSQIYTVIGTDLFGCQNTDDVLIEVTPVITPIIDADILAGCMPLTVTFDNLTAAGTNSAWNFGDGQTSVGFGPQTNTYNSSGNFTVSLTVTDVAGCSYSTTVIDYITVYDNPHASFTADQYVLDDFDSEVTFTNNSTNATWYNWQFGDGSAIESDQNPIHHFELNGQNSTYTVSLVAGNSYDCTDSMQVIITIQDAIIFYVPNAFTPDGDEFNETFVPVFVSGYDPYDYHLMIFNRWGEVVFESYNTAVGWSGTYSNQGLVEDGVYVWKIEFRETMSDKRHNYTGHVTVLK